MLQSLSLWQESCDLKSNGLQGFCYFFSPLKPTTHSVIFSFQIHFFPKSKVTVIDYTILYPEKKVYSGTKFNSFEQKTAVKMRRRKKPHFILIFRNEIFFFSIFPNNICLSQHSKNHESKATSKFY